jgi:hypothetical protein
MSIDNATFEDWSKSSAKAWCHSGNEMLNKLAKEISDGSSANYYKLPENASELQDLISAKNLNAQIGEIFRECYRYGKASHCDEERGIRKILFYANAELNRLTNLKGN